MMQNAGISGTGCNELLVLNVYPLETVFNNYFLTGRNNEIILPYLRGTTNDIETTNGPVGYKQGAIGFGATSPTRIG